MDWRLPRQRLEPRYEAAIATVKAHYPAISAGTSWRSVGDPGIGIAKFDAHVAFCYDPAQQEWEDLLLFFTCAPADRGGFWRAYDVPWFPEPGGRDAVGFELERGDGHTLAALDPMLLPQDESSPDYERLVLDYADRAGVLIQEHMALILDALREPYLPRNEITPAELISMIKMTIRGGDELEWAKALLAELEARSSAVHVQTTADLEDACSKVRRLIELAEESQGR